MATLAPRKQPKSKLRVKVGWLPNPGGQRRFLACPYFEALLEGNRGGGKTETLLMDFCQFVGMGYGASWRGVLFRETYPNLEDVVAKATKLIPRMFPAPKARWNASRYMWVFQGGERLYFRHAERVRDYWKYHGHEYPWVAFEELSNWADDELYLMMMSVCRSSNPDVPRRYRSTCNPYGRGHHWIKHRFIDPAPRGTVIRQGEQRPRVAIHCDLFENFHLLGNDPNYVKTLQALEGPKREAWLLGNWNIVAGGMFGDIWDEKRHIVEPFDLPKTWYIDRSFDWGSSKPYSVQWWAESDGCTLTVKDGRTVCTRPGDLFLFAEDYGWTGKPNQGVYKTAAEIAERVRHTERAWPFQVKAGPADPSIFAVENGNSIATDMERHGIRWLRANAGSGSRINGWEMMRELLKNVTKPEGARLFVFSTCRQFIRTVPALPRDEKNMDDADSAAEDHCLRGDMGIVTSTGVVQIGDLVGTTGEVLSVGGRFRPYCQCRRTRRKAALIHLVLADESVIVCTPDHRLWTVSGWKEACEWMSPEFRQRFSVSWVSPALGPVVGGLQVVTAERTSPADVYCLVVPTTQAFILSNGVVSHNCGDAARYRVLAKQTKSGGVNVPGLF